MNSRRNSSQRRRAAFRPRLEHLESRDCPSCTVFQTGDKLHVLGDRGANNIAIAEIREGGVDEERGGISVVCDGSVIQAFTGVRQVDLRTLGGDDEITFDCPADTSTFLLRADLGADHDRLSISGFDPQPEPPLRAFAFDILAGEGDDEVRFDLGAAEINGRFRIFADGGGGNDFLAVVMGDGSVMPRSDTRISLSGGAGDDVIEAHVTSLANYGRFALNVGGGDGNDHLVAALGMPRTFPASETRVALSGDAGDDRIEAHVDELMNYGRFLLEADGGGGNDFLAVVMGDGSVMPRSDTRIALRGGAGDDKIEANVTGLANYGRFELNVGGGGGNDHLEVAAGDGSVLPESEMRIKLNGDAGDDVIEASLTGRMNQRRSVLEADGGAGNDRIAARVEMDQESRGGPYIRILGGRGDDDLTLALYGVDVESLATALVDGGRGRDMARVTRNVRVANCEEVFFLDDLN